MKKTLFALMAFAIAAASCSKDESSTPEPGPTPPPPVPPVVDTTTFTATIKGAYTKTTFDGTKVKWNDGDSITINGIGYVGVTKAEDAGVAAFTKDSTIANPVKPYYAFFPAGIQTEGVNGILPAVQKYSEGKFDNVPMFAHSDSLSLFFDNICGVIAVKVTPSDISKVAAIRLSSTDVSMCGAFTVKGDTLAVLTTETKDTLNEVILVCNEPVTVDATKTFYIAVPAQKYADINVEISTDGISYQKGMYVCGDSPVSVERSGIYTIDFRADAPTANCYIATEAVTDTIKATKGCSPEMVGRIKDVTVLWESIGTSVAPSENALVSDVKYLGNGFISYTTTGAKGNAVIAALDSAKNILWSWHIWCTYQPQEQVYNNEAGILMDRNLGATDTTRGKVESIGLMYQWGRKDPFMGPDNIGSPTQAKSTHNGNWKNTDGPRVVSHSIENPMEFITSGIGLWSLTPGTVWGAKKTMYDPCPVGWQVASGGLWGVWRKAEDDDVKPKYDGTNYGFQFGGSTPYFTEAKSCWYPAAGYIDGTGQTEGLTGKDCFYWSCTGVPLLPIAAWCLKAKTTSEIDLLDNDSRANGMPVRCQKISEAE